MRVVYHMNSCAVISGECTDLFSTRVARFTRIGFLSGVSSGKVTYGGSELSERDALFEGGSI